MNDNEEQVQKDDEGFYILKRRNQDQAQAEQDLSVPKSNYTREDAPKGSKSEHKEKPKRKEKKYTFLFWDYDGLIRGCVLKRGKNFTLPLTVNLNSEKDKEKHEDQLEEFRIKEKGLPLKLPVGLKFLAKKHQKSIEPATLDKSNFEEFLKMVQPAMENAQRKTILQLVCTILSSYWIRKIVASPIIDDCYLDSEELHAFCTSINPDEGAYLALKKIAESVIVDTCVESNYFEIRTTAIIPQSRGSDSIKDDTFLMVQGYGGEESHWPAPYRDTAVVLDARKLKKKDIEDFASINPWCTCIMYGKNIKLPYRYNDNINGTPLAYMNPDWDEEKVHDLVEAYAVGIYNTSQETIESLWIQVRDYWGQCVDSSNSKMSPAKQFRKRTELLALATFLNFCKDECAIPEEDFQNTKCSLLNIFLPGCYRPPVSEMLKAGMEPENSEMSSDPNSGQENTPQQAFQDILGKMIQTENRQHFLFVREHETYDRVNPDDPVCEYWGYLRIFIPRKNGTEEFPSLCFRQKDFEKVAFSIAGTSATELIKAVRKETPDYLYSVDKGRFPTESQEDKNPVAAIILDIRKMSFLSESQRTLLWEYFPADALQTPPEAEN